MKIVTNKPNENSVSDHFNTLIDIVSKKKSDLIILQENESIVGKYSSRTNKFTSEPLDIYYSCSEKAITLKPKVGDTVLISQLKINSLKNKGELFGEDYLEKSKGVLSRSKNKTTISLYLSIKNKESFKNSILGNLSRKIKNKKDFLYLSKDFSDLIYLPKESIELNHKYYLSKFRLGESPILNREALIDLIVKDVLNSSKYNYWSLFSQENIESIHSSVQPKYLIKDSSIINELLDQEQKDRLIEKINKATDLTKIDITNQNILELNNNSEKLYNWSILNRDKALSLINSIIEEEDEIELFFKKMNLLYRTNSSLFDSDKTRCSVLEAFKNRIEDSINNKGYTGLGIFTIIFKHNKNSFLKKKSLEYNPISVILDNNIELKDEIVVDFSLLAHFIQNIENVVDLDKDSNSVIDYIEKNYNLKNTKFIINIENMYDLGLKTYNIYDQKLFNLNLPDIKQNEFFFGSSNSIYITILKKLRDKNLLELNKKSLNLLKKYQKLGKVLKENFDEDEYSDIFLINDYRFSFIEGLINIFE